MPEKAAENLKVGGMTYEELGVRLFAPVPDRFDPIKASDHELRAHGYPDRPDAEDHPELHELWKQLMSRVTLMVAPVLIDLPVVEPPTVVSPGNPPPPTRGSSGNWAGSVAFAPAGDAVTSVIGAWTVPHVVIPPGAHSSIPYDSQAYICATWVGIDGWNGDPGSLHTDPLQAGTTQLIASVLGGMFTIQSTFAWWEWVPDPPFAIENVPVSAGDVMFCRIEARSETEASFFFLNGTTGAATSFAKTAPAHTKLHGISGEWILELPIGSVYGHPLKLAEYWSVFFGNCLADTRLGHLVPGGTGDLITMVNADNVPISSPQALGETAIRVDHASGTAAL
jgi:hypothetical protein